MLDAKGKMNTSRLMRTTKQPLASRARLNYLADIIAFAAGTVVFTTGLILLTRFHMGEGALNGSALGISRLSWVNTHRLTAVALLTAIAIHAYLHWHAVTVRVSHAYKNLSGKATRADLILYFGFAIELLAGLTAWLVLPGSPTLLGPVRLAPLNHVRHICIDVHNISGLILLPAAVIHVRRHFGWLLRASGLGRTTVFTRDSITSSGKG